jgi:hypothetical protein
MISMTLPLSLRGKILASFGGQSSRLGQREYRNLVTVRPAGATVQVPGPSTPALPGNHDLVLEHFRQAHTAQYQRGLGHLSGRLGGPALLLFSSSNPSSPPPLSPPPPPTLLLPPPIPPQPPPRFGLSRWGGGRRLKPPDPPGPCPPQRLRPNLKGGVPCMGGSSFPGARGPA